MYKPIICLDFDGVIHSYKTKWKGPEVIPDPPVPGAFDAIMGYMEYFKVHIYSTRSNTIMGIEAMINWFTDHGFDRVGDLYFPTEKPPALITIDDRAITFTGVFPSVDEIKSFKPWNKK